MSLLERMYLKLKSIICSGSEEGFKLVGLDKDGNEKSDEDGEEDEAEE